MNMITVFFIIYFIVGAILYFCIEGFTLTWKNKIIFDFSDNHFAYFALCVLFWLFMVLFIIYTMFFGTKIDEE
jgi:hypothetical protein